MTFNRYRITNHKPSSGLRRLGLGLAFVGLIFMFGFNKMRSSLPNKLRTEIETKLNDELERFGLTASLRQAEFFDGKGIRLTEFRVIDQDSRDRKCIIDVHEVFIETPITLTELALGQTRVRAVDFRGGKLGLRRDINGNWRLASLLEHLRSKCNSKSDGVAIRLNDFNLRIVDESATSEQVHQIRDVNLIAREIIHDNNKLVQITGECAGLAASQIQFESFVNPVQHSWFGKFQVRNAQLTTELLTLLPEQSASVFEGVQVIGGQLDLQGSANGNLNITSIPQFDITGQLRNFSLSDQRFPLSLKSCRVDFRVTPLGFKVKRAVGQAGQGTFDVSYQQQGLLTKRSWSAEGQLVGFDLTDEIHPWLPGSCQQFCKDFSPKGTSNINFQMAFDGRQYTRNMTAEITNMEFNFHKFPYPFQQCRGRVSWIGDNCTYDIQTNIGRQPVRISGKANRPGSQSTYVVDVDANGKFAIDEKLLAALTPYPEVKKQILAFRTTGFLSCTGSIFKNLPTDIQTAYSFDVQLHDCNVKHDAFQYPIGNVNGLVRVQNGDCNFENVTGTNGNATVRCDGSWIRNLGLELRFLCRQVPFDETLRNALSTNIQEIWNEIRPSGKIGLLRVQLHLPPGDSALDLVVDANLADDEGTQGNPHNGPPQSNVSIFPTWFPYEINQLMGAIKIGRGQIEMVDMNGKHRRTSVECQGIGTYSEQTWSVSLKNMLVRALRVEDDLLHALPHSLSQPLTILEFDGLLNIQGEITMSGSQVVPANSPSAQQSNIAQISFLAPVEQAATKMFWDLRLDMDQASLLLGLPVKNVFGMVRLAGQYDGLTAACAGELAIDSMTLLGAQITDIQGPIWIDERGTSAGTLARQSQNSQPRQIVGKICNGQIRFDARKQVDDDGKFYVQTSLTGGCLQDLVSDFAPYVQNISGKCQGALRFTGDDTGAHSYRGEGTMQLHEAQIYELPLVLSLLKILQIKEVNRTAFDSSNIDFTIDGNDVELNRIELIGDAISLIGKGQVNFNRQLNLDFYSVVGRNLYIPLLSELYRAGSQSILWINVDGTLDQPNTHRHILPQLNDTIRTLLQPPEGGQPRDGQFFPGRPLELFDPSINPANKPYTQNSFSNPN